MQPTATRSLTIHSLTKTVACSVLALAGTSAAINAFGVELGTFGGTEVSLKGYLKLDAIFSDYRDGALSAGNLGKDFYVPSLTPVGGQSESSSVDFHARQTRFAIGTKSNIDGITLKTFIEMGFLATPDGNERITNSYEPRMRHAFLEYNNWLFGQTWSTFMDVGALPETLDFIGNTDASVFVRQAQVRYTLGNFQFALENPETTVTPFGGGARVVTDDNSLPDAVIRYNYKASDFSLSIAGLFRQLQYDDGAAIDDTETSYGIAVSGVYKIGRDDIKFLINSGSGLGRYVGLNITNGAVVNAQNKLEAIDTTAYYISYRHHWNDQWRSTVSYSAIDIDNDVTLTGAGVSEGSSSVRLNLIYSPTSRLSLGGELAVAERDVESGASGKMDRLQFSAKLTF